MSWIKEKFKSNIDTIMLCSYFIAAITGYLLMKEDISTLIRWWLFILLLGISVFPISMKLFSKFGDLGWFFSKIIGLAMTGYLMWLAASIKMLRFQVVSCFLVWIIMTFVIYGTAAFFLHKTGNRTSVVSQIRGCGRTILIRELSFFALLIFFSYLFGTKIIGTETEKSMDLAFMNTIARTEYFPPKDMWASGTNLNYYYFGQYLFTFLSKLSFIKIGEGYCLAIATLASSCFMAVYCIVEQMMTCYMVHIGRNKHGIAVLAGIFSAVGVTFAGNMHYLIFGKLVPMVWEILQIPGDVPSYWFASSTRYIGYIPDVTGDKTISEFPIYSFLIGDLHAHVIDILFILTIIGLLFSWLLEQKREEKLFLVELTKQPKLLMLTFLLGICSMTNYWDFPIYYVVCGSVILFGNLRYQKNRRRAAAMTLLEGFWMFILIELLALPFTLNFDKMIQGIGICRLHSKFYQLVIMWGFPVIMVTAFLIAYIRNMKRDNHAEHTENERTGRADLFCLLLGLCAIGLILLPEIIYVKDIYEEGFPRANTMFKLTYEAFILFGIVNGYIIARFLCLPQNKVQKRVGIVGLICLLLTTGYFFMAAKMWLGSYWHSENYQGINAEAYYEEKMPVDYQAAVWLREHVSGQPVVLEAEGESYTDYERISVLTGLPTVLGWHTHEWLWKNSYEFMSERQADVERIFTSSDQNEVMALLTKYKITYICVGEKEMERYGSIHTDILNSLGSIVYSNQDQNSSILIYQIKQLRTTNNEN